MSVRISNGNPSSSKDVFQFKRKLKNQDMTQTLTEGGQLIKREKTIKRRDCYQ